MIRIGIQLNEAKGAPAFCVVHTKMKYEEMQLSEKTKPSVTPVIAAAIIFPVTVILWVLNHYGGVVESGEGDWEDEGRFAGNFFCKLENCQ